MAAVNDRATTSDRPTTPQGESSEAAMATVVRDLNAPGSKVDNTNNKADLDKLNASLVDSKQIPHFTIVGMQHGEVQNGHQTDKVQVSEGNQTYQAKYDETNHQLTYQRPAELPGSKGPETITTDMTTGTETVVAPGDKDTTRTTTAHVGDPACTTVVTEGQPGAPSGKVLQTEATNAGGQQVTTQYHYDNSGKLTDYTQTNQNGGAPVRLPDGVTDAKVDPKTGELTYIKPDGLKVGMMPDGTEPKPQPVSPEQVPTWLTDQTLKNPDRVRHWWDSLPPEQQEGLLEKHPAWLGNLDGMPAAARDHINQGVMNADVDAVEAAARSHGLAIPGAGHVPDKSKDWTDFCHGLEQDPGKYGLTSEQVTRYENGVRTKAGLDYDSKRADKGQDQSKDDGYGENRPVLLWAYDPLAFNGKGKAAIAIGNPDVAPNIAVVVPGTGSHVTPTSVCDTGWMVAHDDPLRLYEQARAADPTHPTSVIAWMGYDAPNAFTDQTLFNPANARAGAHQLTADIESLRAAHSGSQPHITVIGHSYGSTVVSDAAVGSPQGGHMTANDIVLLGCPGTDLATSAEDYNLQPGGHVYVGAASNDYIPFAPAGNPVIGLGKDPAESGFGATRIRAELPDSKGYFQKHAHGAYFDYGGEAMRGMTDIITGNPDWLNRDDLHTHGKGWAIAGAEMPHTGALDPEWLRNLTHTITGDHSYPETP
jgi:hypothetical protein